jgi:hypothetical protein
LAIVLAFTVGCECRKRDRPAPEVTTVPARTIAVPGKTISRPGRRPTLIATVVSSSLAETSDTPAAWTALADEYERELTGCEVDCREVAYDLVVARTRALRATKVPRPASPDLPPPPELQASLDAIDAYVDRLPAADDEVAPMQFLAANALWQWDHQAAVPRLEDLLEAHRDDATAEYAANQILHTFIEAGRMDELRTWVAELSADETFLANKPELRATLQRLRELLASTSPD